MIKVFAGKSVVNTRQMYAGEDVRHAIRVACKEQPFNDYVVIYRDGTIIGEWKRVRS